MANGYMAWKWVQRLRRNLATKDEEHAKEKATLSQGYDKALSGKNAEIDRLNNRVQEFKMISKERQTQKVELEKRLKEVEDELAATKAKAAADMERAAAEAVEAYKESDECEHDRLAYSSDMVTYAVRQTIFVLNRDANYQPPPEVVVPMKLRDPEFMAIIQKEAETDDLLNNVENEEEQEEEEEDNEEVGAEETRGSNDGEAEGAEKSKSGEGPSSEQPSSSCGKPLPFPSYPTTVVDIDDMLRDLYTDPLQKNRGNLHKPPQD